MQIFTKLFHYVLSGTFYNVNTSKYEFFRLYLIKHESETQLMDLRDDTPRPLLKQFINGTNQNNNQLNVY